MFDNGFFLNQICCWVGPRCVVHLHLLPKSKCAATPSVHCTLNYCLHYEPWIIKLPTLSTLLWIIHKWISYNKTHLHEDDVKTLSIVAICCLSPVSLIWNNIFTGYKQSALCLFVLLCQKFTAVFLINHKPQWVITDQALDWPKFLLIKLIKAYVLHRGEQIFVQIHSLKAITSHYSATQ